MSYADISDYADIRACNSGKLAHFSKVIDTHFQHGYLMFFVHFKNSQRKPAFVIKVSLCLVNVVFLSQYGCDHFLGTGLADASGNTYDFYVERVTVEFGDVKQSLSGSLYQYVRIIGITQIFVGYNTECALLDGIRDELVCIKTLSVDRYKEKVLFYLAAVNGNAGNFPV